MSNLRSLFQILFGVQSLLFLYTLLGGFFTILLLRVFDHWTGNYPVWHITSIAFVVGCIIAWVMQRFVARWVGRRVCAWLTVLIALIMCYTFANTAAVVESWRLITWRNDLTFDLWRTFILRNALLWFVPSFIALPILFTRNDVPRGKLTVFCGICCGIILARLFVGILPTIQLVDICLGGLLLLAFLLVGTTAQSRWTRGVAGLLFFFFGTAYYIGTVRSAQDLLADFHPFAYIAQRDSRYIGNPAGFTLKDGRILRVEGFDEASLTASQALPLLFKPAANARIATRLQTGEPAFTFYETSELKGLYDALWIELPPAWLATEQDYFGSAALSAVIEHLHEDGILIYHMDARAMDETMLRSRTALLRKHFNHVHLWMTGLNQWQWVASRKPMTVSLQAIDALVDREAVMRPLQSVNIATPMTLLASCMLSDLSVLEQNTPAKMRFMERRFGRENLFDNAAGRRLIAAILPYYQTSAPWVVTHFPFEQELVETLRTAKKIALEGTLKENPQEIIRAYQTASLTLAQDPFLLGLADHEFATARDWEALARYDAALQVYASTIAYVQPPLPIVLHAATLAHQNNYTALAIDFYRIAEDLAPENLSYLKSYVHFLRERKQFKDAEQICLRILRVAAEESPEDVTMARFYLGVCIAQQPDRKQEGLDVLKAFMNGLKTDKERDAYTPAYAQFLIDMGNFKEGLEIRRSGKLTD